MIETSLDRLTMLSDFGVSAIYTHDGSNTTVTGIFDSDYEAVTTGGGVPFAMEQPRFHCRTEDVPSAVDGDLLEINGRDFVIRVVMPDGTGMTELQLEKA